MRCLPRPAGSAMWMDLGVPDLEAAREFYAELFGWTLTEHESPMGTYVSASTERGDVGGMMAQDPDTIAAGAPAAWTVVFAVDDIDSAHRRVTELGGAIVAGPFEIPGGDRIAYVTDPAGAAFAIMQSSQAGGGMVWGELGAAGWVECQTRDPERSQAFYESLFGWRRSTPDGVDYTVFTHGTSDVAGLMKTPDQVPDEVPSYWMVYWLVDDLDATVTKVGELGGDTVVPPTTVEDMRFAVVEDSQGAAFGLLPAAAMRHNRG